MGIICASGSKATTDLVIKTLSPSYPIEKIKLALRHLKNQGKITYLSGSLDISLVDQPVRVPEKQGKIWRAMRWPIFFNVKEIEISSGAKRSYINKYLLFLIKEGYVRKARKPGRAQSYIMTEKATPKVPVYSRKQEEFKIPAPYEPAEPPSDKQRQEIWQEFREQAWNLTNEVNIVDLDRDPAKAQEIINELQVTIGKFGVSWLEKEIR